MEKLALFGLIASCSLVAAVRDTGLIDEVQEQPQTAVAESQDDFQIPEWPASFTMSYTFSLPYVKKIQPDGLEYPVTVYVDDEEKKFRMDVYHGLDTTIETEGYSYTSSPRIDGRICLVASGGPISNEESQEYLPDLSTWTYVGLDDINNESYRLFVYKNEEMDRNQMYKFWLTLDNKPHKLTAFGQDFWSGSHYDVYEAVWHSFEPGRPDASVFELPAVCAAHVKTPTEGPMANAHLTVTSLLPTLGLPHVDVGDAEFDAFVAAQGRNHGSQQEYHFRRGVYHRNAAFVKEWNEQNKRMEQEARYSNRRYTPRHTVALNHFADWTETEFRTLALGRLRREGSTVEGELAPQSNYIDHGLPYEPEAKPEDLPESLSYRNSPVYSPVKDQASCGSCWAFGTTVALQSAWYKATGEVVSFSEQQFVDCSWNYFNYGCSGGLQDRAISYVVQAGGLAKEWDYQYLGQNGFCKENDIDFAAKFKGYVMLPPRDHVAMREALYSQGPIAVGIDAAHLSFRFYSSGVYYNEECCSIGSSWCIDHLVGYVGYGEQDGLRYYEIQNSWSPYWGDDGFMKVAVDYDCGVSLEATYAIADAPSRK